MLDLPRLRAWILGVALCGLFFPSSAWAQTPSLGGDPQELVEISSPSPAALRAQLRVLGYDVDCLPRSEDSVFVVTSDAEHQQLVAAGFNLTLQSTAAPLSALLSGAEGLPLGYRDSATIQADLLALAAAHPGLVSLVNLAAVYGPGATVEGRGIWAAKISDNAAVDEDEPNILLACCHHSRGIDTPELAMETIEELLQNYSSDPEVNAWVNDNEIWVIPLVNPDGYAHVWNGNNLWRKNRKPLPGGEIGVDLNRNYAFGWAASCGGSQTPSSSTYRGPSAASEEEVQTMMAFLLDRRFAKVLDFHSAAQQVRRRYPCAAMPSAFDTLNTDEADRLAQASQGEQTAPSCCLGGDIHQEMFQNTASTFLIETHTQFQPPFASAQAEIAGHVLPLIREALRTRIPVVGHVVDAQSGLGVEAQISVVGEMWLNGETRRSDPVTGRFHLWLPAGSWTLDFSAPGLQGSAAVTVVSGATSVVNLSLAPSTGSFDLQMSTTGGASYDLQIELLNIPATFAVGYTLISFDTAQALGGGAFAGLSPDLMTLAAVASAPAATNPLHWTPPLLPGVFPLAALILGPGGVPPLGVGLDARGLVLDASLQFLDWTPVRRVIF